MAFSFLQLDDQTEDYTESQPAGSGGHPYGRFMNNFSPGRLPFVKPLQT